MTLSAGTRLGPYEIQSPLGAEGMGEDMLVGEPEKALDQLEPLLKIPYFLSPGWLKIDPNFDPLRKNPRFQKLVAGTTVASRAPLGFRPAGSSAPALRSRGARLLPSGRLRAPRV